jgi:hypothetical protein
VGDPVPRQLAPPGHLDKPDGRRGLMRPHASCLMSNHVQPTKLYKHVKLVKLGVVGVIIQIMGERESPFCTCTLQLCPERREVLES